jgi:outer membrane protein OmpA-like peptidoglycan-associated protein
MFFIVTSIYPQFDILNKVKKKVERKIDKNIDKSIDEVLDGTEKEIKEGANEENKNKEENQSKEDTKSLKDDTDDGNLNKSSEANLKVWSKYNFVPGDEIILFDDLKEEESGEFPSRWDLVAGSAENASLGEVKVISLENKSVIKPLMNNDNYLPEVFTIEFDAYFDKIKYVNWQSYNIRFWAGRSWGSLNELSDKTGTIYSLKIFRHGASITGRIDKENFKYEAFEKSLEDNGPNWRRIALAFNKRSLKVFVDKERVLNIPNFPIKPKMFSIEGYTGEDAERLIKNIRIAEGGKGLYDRIVADGKFITRGITFDVNKATIKPESMGVISKIVKLMNKHSDLNFSIEGHTDSDGDETLNQKLSEQRAESVKNLLLEMGIEKVRLESKGFGEIKPIDENNNPEGKANNRRVEFVKL